MLLDAEQSQLVLVDYQARLMPAIFEHAAVLANAVRLAKLARLMGVPVTGTEQNPSRLGENAPELRELCDRTLAKMQFRQRAQPATPHAEGGRERAQHDRDQRLRSPCLPAADRAGFARRRV